MNIFLFGASGPTGKEVLIRLLENGHHVKILVRSPHSLQGINPPLLEVIKGDVLSPETYSSRFTNNNMIISSLGTGTTKGLTTIYS